jgi:hypothetical protein
LDFSISIATMLINMIQHGESSTSALFLMNPMNRQKNRDRQRERDRDRQTDTNKSLPGGILDFSISIGTMLINIIQHGESSTSASFLTNSMEQMHIQSVKETERQTNK